MLAIVLDHNNVGWIVTASEDNDNVLGENVLLVSGMRLPNRNESKFTCDQSVLPGENVMSSM